MHKLFYIIPAAMLGGFFIVPVSSPAQAGDLPDYTSPSTRPFRGYRLTSPAEDKKSPPTLHDESADPVLEYLDDIDWNNEPIVIDSHRSKTQLLGDNLMAPEVDLDSTAFNVDFKIQDVGSTAEGPPPAKTKEKPEEASPKMWRDLAPFCAVYKAPQDPQDTWLAALTNQQPPYPRKTPRLLGFIGDLSNKLLKQIITHKLLTVFNKDRAQLKVKVQDLNRPGPPQIGYVWSGCFHIEFFSSQLNQPLTKLLLLDKEKKDLSPDTLKKLLQQDPFDLVRPLFAVQLEVLQKLPLPGWTDRRIKELDGLLALATAALNKRDPGQFFLQLDRLSQTVKSSPVFAKPHAPEWQVSEYTDLLNNFLQATTMLDTNKIILRYLRGLWLTAYLASRPLPDSSLGLQIKELQEALFGFKNTKILDMICKPYPDPRDRWGLILAKLPEIKMVSYDFKVLDNFRQRPEFINLVDRSVGTVYEQLIYSSEDQPYVIVPVGGRFRDNDLLACGSQDELCLIALASEAMRVLKTSHIYYSFRMERAGAGKGTAPPDTALILERELAGLEFQVEFLKNFLPKARRPSLEKAFPDLARLLTAAAGGYKQPAWRQEALSQLITPASLLALHDPRVPSYLKESRAVVNWMDAAVAEIEKFRAAEEQRLVCGAVPRIKNTIFSLIDALDERWLQDRIKLIRDRSRKIKVINTAGPNTLGESPTAEKSKTKDQNQKEATPSAGAFNLKQMLGGAVALAEFSPSDFDRARFAQWVSAMPQRLCPVNSPQPVAFSERLQSLIDLRQAIAFLVPEERLLQSNGNAPASELDVLVMSLNSLLFDIDKDEILPADSQNLLKEGKAYDDFNKNILTPYRQEIENVKKLLTDRAALSPQDELRLISEIGRQAQSLLELPDPALPLDPAFLALLAQRATFLRSFSQLSLLICYPSAQAAQQDIAGSYICASSPQNRARWEEVQRRVDQLQLRLTKMLVPLRAYLGQAPLPGPY